MARKANPGVRCGVCSCAYHNAQDKCQLDSIHIEPMPNAHKGTPDESMCGSYANKQ